MNVQLQLLVDSIVRQTTVLSKQARGVVIAVAALLLTFCGGETADSGSSESHFLSPCSDSCASGLSCICGVGTKPCATDTDCSALSAGTSCAASTCDTNSSVATSLARPPPSAHRSARATTASSSDAAVSLHQTAERSCAHRRRTLRHNASRMQSTLPTKPARSMRIACWRRPAPVATQHALACSSPPME